MPRELINSQNCRDFALRWAKENRRGWDQDRVAGIYLDIINTKVRLIIQKSVNSHPTIGKTIKEIV
ncbi:MAG: hypothetical protein GWO41_04035 [candidate division Zixibacteria bacterium]|nr:hypothetical protein [candidate division Zixibacteria bacterium]NIR65760.1 hypothetical protein [candidate division Zixibacteria bacterium]NIS45967.1 hypothetical protein [candidate division Zixibacteria bacterium]NIT51926.1 hypothetical protein [candidate division Zixibacteria bacterium]NIU14092.1 hypothetical protein [candidate division Zixibacteria bacterium]